MASESAQASEVVSTFPKFMRRISDSELGSLSSTQKGFIVTIRSLDGTMEGQQLKDMIAELFPPAKLFAKEICDLPSVWVELRNFLNARGATLQQHSSHRVINTLAHELYAEAEDRDSAIRSAQLIIADGRKVRPDLQSTSSRNEVTPSPSSSSASDLDSTRLAHNVAMRLKDSEKKFSGDLGECWMDYVDEYSQIARDYGLSPRQKLQYLHNLLCKDAKRFYLEQVEMYAQSYQQAVDMINREYNSPVRQTRVKNYLNTIRVSHFVKKGHEVSSALAKVYKLITKLSRQVPPSHRGDSHKIEFLRNATVGFPWSHEPLSRVATHSLTFQGLYGELEAALQLDKEARLAIARDGATRSSHSFPDDSQVNYAEQGRYARHPSRVRGTRRGAGKGMFDPLSIAGCFNCGDESHMLKDCKKPINAAKAASKRLEYYKSKKGEGHAIHVVLAELCRQVDTAASPLDNDGSSGPASDADIFESIVLAMENQEEGELTLCEPDVGEDTDASDIFVLATQWMSPPSNAFEGACVDSGAQKTVIGTPQAQAYCSLLNNDLGSVIRGKKRTFMFGGTRHVGLGSIRIRFPVSAAFFIVFDADVVDINIPLLLGLDVLTRAKVVLDFDSDIVKSKTDGWRMPLTRKRGHVYIEWPVSVFFTSEELRKVHRHFYHPHPGKLYALIRKADPTRASKNLMSDLENITATCEVCQREADAPHRFRVALPFEDCVFNRTVSLDLMYLSGRSVLHIVDRDTKFNAACFLRGESSANIWEAFMRVWVTTYLGFPDRVATDQGPQFTSREWKSLLHAAEIKEQLSGVESHNAIGPGERYHAFLRRVYNKVVSTDEMLDKDLALQLAVKAVNDTAGPSGLVPTLLVFGVIPRIPIFPKELPDHRSRMKAMQSARNEMAVISHEGKLKTALAMNVPSAAEKTFSIGDEVLLYREKPIGKWIGPFIVLGGSEKVLTIDDGDRHLRVSVDKVKLHKSKEPQRADKVNATSATHPVEGAPFIPKEGPDNEDQNLHKEKSLNVSEEDNLISRLLQGDTEDGFDASILRDVLDREFDEEPDIDVHITEVLKTGDEREQSPEFRAAKVAEISGLLARKVWTPVKESSVPSSANILGGRFVLAIKDTESGKRKEKARFIVQGHRDKDKPYLVHEIPTLRAASVRIVLSVAAICRFRIFSHDVTQAFVQSRDFLSREIFVRPRACDRDVLGVDAETLLRLERPLYGICDAGDYWGVTFHDHVRKEMKMSPALIDRALYMRHTNGALDGVTAVCVDDTLHAGLRRFEKDTEATLKKFDSRPREYDSFNFFGARLATSGPGEFNLSQSRHAENLELLPKDSTYELFRKRRAALAWLCNSCPDLCCAINRASQVTEKTFGRAKVIELNLAIKSSKKKSKRGLKYGSLDSDSLLLKMYADAAFATNDDLSSQLGYLIVLCDKNNRAHVIDFSSKNSKRVVRSIMAGEVFAFVDGFDKCFVIRQDLEAMLNRSIPIHCFTDSKQLFDALTKGQQTTEKRLMIDILAARESYQEKHIARVGLVSSEENPADGLSKIRDNGALSSLLESGRDNCSVQQWIVRQTQAPNKENAGV